MIRSFRIPCSVELSSNGYGPSKQDFLGKKKIVHTPLTRSNIELQIIRQRRALKSAASRSSFLAPSRSTGSLTDRSRLRLNIECEEFEKEVLCKTYITGIQMALYIRSAYARSL